MSYSQNPNGYCNSCDWNNGCSCGYCGGYGYPTCCAGHNQAAGGNCCVYVCIGDNGQQNPPNNDCCCKNGMKKLLDYLKNKSSDETIKTETMCIHGDTIPERIITYGVCYGNPLLSLTSSAQIQNLSITDDIIEYSNNIISICAMSVIKFTFNEGDDEGINNDAELRGEFLYTPKSTCCNNCGEGIAKALHTKGLGVDYVVTVQDTLLVNNPGNGFAPPLVGCIGCYQGNTVKLVAVDNLIAIFSAIDDDKTIYFGVPTCKIAKLTS